MERESLSIKDRDAAIWQMHLLAKQLRHKVICSMFDISPSRYKQVIKEQKELHAKVDARSNARRA